MRKPPKRVVFAILAAEMVPAVLAWRDIATRTDDQVRGRKKFWRVLIALNPGNSLVYWAVGRR